MEIVLTPAIEKTSVPEIINNYTVFFCIAFLIKTPIINKTPRTLIIEGPHEKSNL